MHDAEITFFADGKVEHHIFQIFSEVQQGTYSVEKDTFYLDFTNTEVKYTVNKVSLNFSRLSFRG